MGLISIRLSNEMLEIINIVESKTKLKKSEILRLALFKFVERLEDEEIKKEIEELFRIEKIRRNREKSKILISNVLQEKTAVKFIRKIKNQYGSEIANRVQEIINNEIKANNENQKELEKIKEEDFYVVLKPKKEVEQYGNK
jgi:predicted DNA-binding protein